MYYTVLPFSPAPQRSMMEVEDKLPTSDGEGGEVGFLARFHNRAQGLSAKSPAKFACPPSKRRNYRKRTLSGTVRALYRSLWYSYSIRPCYIPLQTIQDAGHDKTVYLCTFWHAQVIPKFYSRNYRDCETLYIFRASMIK